MRNSGERRARRHYRLRGYRILAANAWAGGNEVDLVARRGRRLVFCEVKERGREDFGAPVDYVHPEKQRRVRRAAEAWLAARPELDELEISFDVVTVGPEGLRRTADAF
ncbi:MAG: YraN family protein [Gaiellaceae bacterium]